MWNLVCFSAKLCKSYSNGFHETWLRGGICAKRRKIFSVAQDRLLQICGIGYWHWNSLFYSSSLSGWWRKTFNKNLMKCGRGGEFGKQGPTRFLSRSLFEKNYHVGQWPCSLVPTVTQHWLHTLMFLMENVAKPLNSFIILSVSTKTFFPTDIDEILMCLFLRMQFLSLRCCI